LPAYHPDVRVFEVRNSEGEAIGLYYNDPYMRPSKQSGAWMNSFRDQYTLGDGRLPVIVNVMNYSKPEAGQPTLLSWDDAETMFHEFGHALHGLLSNVTYPTLSGTSVPRDYVEFPSQVMEHWFSEPQTLRRYALHAVTGEPMPDALIERLRAADKFNQGFVTVEYLASAFVDMDLHMMGEVPTDFDVSAFERDALARINMPREIIMRHRPPHFGHIVGGYAAGYYGYLWAEVIDADAFEAFEETGDPFNPELAARFRDYIFAAGNLREPMEAYVLFRGREPDPAALLRARGFAPPRN
jgi:peptidyl-dipeptidase Dcp